METRQNRGASQHRICGAAMALFVIGGSWHAIATWDFRRIDVTAQHARSIAGSGDDEAMSGASVVLLRETRSNLDALRAIRSQGGRAGEMAQAAIDQIQQIK